MLGLDAATAHQEREPPDGDHARPEERIELGLGVHTGATEAAGAAARVAAHDTGQARGGAGAIAAVAVAALASTPSTRLSLLLSVAVASVPRTQTPE